MTGAMLTTLFRSVCFLALFLLIGFFMRAKIKAFQETFIPASVIGGFILLLLGPIGFGVLPIPEEWIKIWSLIPGILIVPVVTATPLGLDLGGKNAMNKFKPAVPLFFIMFAAYYLQNAIGFGTNVLFRSMGQDLYDTFGWELCIGYTGGHGTAGILGNMLSELNIPYWETAQGVAVTMATFGLVGGILIGMVLINWAARKGETSVLKEPGDIPQDVKIGYQRDISKQGSLGRETTKSASMDTVTFHSAIIFLGCLIAYGILAISKKYNIPGLKSISVWAYGIIVMFAIWGIIRKLKLDFLIDSNVKGKITGSLTEFAVIGAVASLPLKTVFTYFVPIMVMVILGFIGTVAILLFLCKKYLKVDWFEHMIATLGMSSGVFLTGLLLLKICDPDSESTALGNYSISFSIISAVTFAIMPLILNIILTNGPGTAFILTSGLTVFGIIATIITSKALLKD